MSDIFISYERSNRNAAERLATALSDHGWSVWWDRQIPAGQSFDEVIEREIDAAKCVLVLWSTVSVTSRWVRLEASEGANRGILVPVLLDDDVRIPLEFRKLQAVCLTDWQGNRDHVDFVSLTSAVAALCGTSERGRNTGTRTKRGARGEQPSAPSPVPPGTYLDRDTALMWAVADNGRDITWDGACDYAKRLRLGGFTDWRLPTIDELADLYNPDADDPYGLRHPLKLSSWLVWTSSIGEAEGGPKMELTDAAWFFIFKHGEPDETPDGGYRVLSPLCYAVQDYFRALCVRTVR